jgi:hypothetical protein
MNKQNENSENESPNNFGRKKASFNKLSKEAKENLYTVFENDLQRFDKIFANLPMDEKFTGLKPVVKLLCTGSDEVSIKTKKLIYDSLKREFKMLKFYINQLPTEKRAAELRQYLFCLDKEQIEEIFRSVRR